MTQATPRQPNVIVFLTDQQRSDTTGVQGNQLGLAANFDRMAQQGTHVAFAFTPQPVCGPARSCLQTGMYATKTGCFRNDRPLPTDSQTLAHYFRAAGYTTGYIGKWHLASQDPVPLAERGGYEYWLASNILEFTSDAYHTVVYDHDMQPVRLPGYRVDALADAAIRYVDTHQKKPFYLFLSFLEPHHQNSRDDYPAPTIYRERYAGGWIPPDLAALGGSTHQHIAGYYGMVKRLDEALGRLLDALQSLDLLEHTIVLYASDHGCHFKTRNSEYKRSCHESSIRVPVAVHGPGFNGGGRIGKLVSLVDLPPTLLESAGLPIPAAMQGRSIVPLLRGQTADWPDDVFVQISESQVGRAVRTQRWKYGVDAPTERGDAVPYAERYVEQYLYDLHADPYELHNLVGCDSHRHVADILRERLLRRIIAAGEQPPIIDPAPIHKTPYLHVPDAEAYL